MLGLTVAAFRMRMVVVLDEQVFVATICCKRNSCYP